MDGIFHRYGGPAVLIGDAAHPLLPYAAQGGAQAIEEYVPHTLRLPPPIPALHA